MTSASSSSSVQLLLLLSSNRRRRRRRVRLTVTTIGSRRSVRRRTRRRTGGRSSSSSGGTKGSKVRCRDRVAIAIIAVTRRVVRFRRVCTVVVVVGVYCWVERSLLLLLLLVSRGGSVGLLLSCCGAWEGRVSVVVLRVGLLLGLLLRLLCVAKVEISLGCCSN